MQPTRLQYHHPYIYPYVGLRMHMLMESVQSPKLVLWYFTSAIISFLIMAANLEGLDLQGLHHYRSAMMVYCGSINEGTQVTHSLL